MELIFIILFLALALDFAFLNSISWYVGKASMRRDNFLMPTITKNASPQPSIYRD